MRRKTFRASRKLSRKRKNTFKKRKTNRKRGGRPLGSSPLQLEYEKDCERYPSDPACSEESNTRTPQERKKIFCEDFKITNKALEELREELEREESLLSQKMKAREKKKLRKNIKKTKNALEDAERNVNRFYTPAELGKGGINDVNECEEKSVKDSFNLKNISSRSKKYLKNMSLHGKSMNCHDNSDFDAWFDRNKSNYKHITEIIGKGDKTLYVVNISPGNPSTMRYSELSDIVAELRKYPAFKGKIKRKIFRTSRFKSRYDNCKDRIKEINSWLTTIKNNKSFIEEKHLGRTINNLSRLINGDDDAPHLSEDEYERAFIDTIHREDYMKELADKVRDGRNHSTRENAAYEIYNILQNKFTIDKNSSREDIRKANVAISRAYHQDRINKAIWDKTITKTQGDKIQYIFKEVYPPAKEFFE